MSLSPFENEGERIRFLKTAGGFLVVVGVLAIMHPLTAFIGAGTLLYSEPGFRRAGRRFWIGALNRSRRGRIRKWLRRQLIYVIDALRRGPLG